jgi:uncharacterized protein YdeI (YjbR/CyaY-like superfamily)
LAGSSSDNRAVTTGRDGLPVIRFDSADAWESWLDTNHADSTGLWVQIAKKASGIPTVSYPQAVEAALCFGWIDGQKSGYDDAFFLQRFTPRRPRSGWSKINVEKVAELTRAGRMRPAGLAEVEAAKADGRWEAAYGGSASITVPDDLQAALDANPAAREFFATVSRANRYAVLYRVVQAKRPETRARRISTLVSMLAEGRTLH